MNDVFRHYGLNILRNILDDSGTSALLSLASLERPAAIGTAVEPVFFLAVNFLGFGTAGTGMALLSARLLFFSPR